MLCDCTICSPLWFLPPPGSGYLRKRLNPSVSTWSTTLQRSPRVAREASGRSSRRTSGPGSTRGECPGLALAQPPVLVAIATVTRTRLHSLLYYNTASTLPHVLCIECVHGTYRSLPFLLYTCYYSINFVSVKRIRYSSIRSGN